MKIFSLRIERNRNYGWRWWYVALGSGQPFGHFGHGGWFCLSPSWIKRFWGFAAVLLLLVLTAVLASGQATTPPPTTPPATTSNGFSGTTEAVAIDYAGTWSVGTLASETYDLYDFGAKKTNHLYVQGQELIAPTPGFNAYLGGIEIQPDFSSLFSKANVPASAFSVFLNASIGNGIPTTGPSAITWLAGGGVQYQVTSNLTWQTLRASYGRFGANGFPVISTGLSFIFGGKQ